MNYAKHVSTKQTPQSEPIPGKQMVENNAGGYGFEVDAWTRLDRFLILGSEGGTYYVGERELTRENAKNVEECLRLDGIRAVNRIVEISEAGRAPKNDPAVFALALASVSDDPKTRAAARASITKVCRTGTHLFHFCQAVQSFGKWPRGMRRGVGAFYTERATNDELALQLVKYQNRDGWTHRDVLRLAHPRLRDQMGNSLLRWAVGKDVVLQKGKTPNVLYGTYLIRREGVSPSAAAAIIREYRLPRECVPTELLNSSAVWAALLEMMPLTALIRNLAKMTTVGLMTSNFDAATDLVVNRLTNPVDLRKARIHPMAVLLASKVYAQGHGFKGDNRWDPVPKVVDALEAAFYLAFDNVVPTGKNLLLGVDVSGSMDGATIAGTCLDARTAAAAMALVTYKREPNVELVAFSRQMVPIPMTKNSTLESTIRTMQRIPMGGGTDCAMPMLHAIKKGLPIDAFVIYTDNETWAGDIHPVQALQKFRRSSGRPAKCVVVGMTATGFSIADPNDAGMMDVVGFDSAAPAVISNFIQE